MLCCALLCCALPLHVLRQRTPLCFCASIRSTLLAVPCQLPFACTPLVPSNTCIPWFPKGVCFGHQLVGCTLGARVGRAGCWEVSRAGSEVWCDARGTILAILHPSQCSVVLLPSRRTPTRGGLCLKPCVIFLCCRWALGKLRWHQRRESGWRRRGPAGPACCRTRCACTSSTRTRWVLIDAMRATLLAAVARGNPR